MNFEDFIRKKEVFSQPDVLQLHDAQGYGNPSIFGLTKI
jgi:hypothetical protein